MSSTRTTFFGCLLAATLGCGRSGVDTGADAGNDTDAGLDAGGDAGTTDGGPGDAGTRDGGTLPDGGPLWPINAQRIRATEAGGFGNFGCRTDAGVLMRDSSWNLSWPDGQFAFSVCLGGNLREGQKVLSKAQLDAFDVVMRGLVPAASSVCGADKPDLRLLIDTPNGTVLYEDSFYGCLPKPGTVFVDHIDPVFNQLDQFSL